MWKLVARFLAGGRTVSELADWLNVERATLRTVPLDYQTFTIPKRNGRSRNIVAPNPALKVLQRRILRRLLNGLNSHSAARGFERGRGIVEHAALHAGKSVVVNVDIVSYFESTQVKRIHKMFRRFGWGRGATRLLIRLCTHDGGLPQGAPTSPKLSNLVNYFLDERLTEIAESFDATYSRYADDITFSFDQDERWFVNSLVWNVRSALFWAGYVMHHRRKPSVRRQHQRQEVTGLVVNERLTLPREVRRRLRAIRHRIANGQAASITAEELAGWESFEEMVERASMDRTHRRG